MFCSSCGGQQPDGAVYCNACGSPMTASSGPLGQAPTQAAPPQGQPDLGPSPYGGTPYGANPYANPYGGHVQPTTSGMAIAGFVLSFFCGLLGLIFSLVAKSQIRESNGALTGDGLATAGVVISIVGMVLGLMMAVAG